MLFQLETDFKKDPWVYIVAGSLREAYNKFKKSGVEVKLKNDFHSINEIFSGNSDVDIHKGNKPLVYGYRYMLNLIGSIEIERICIADSHEQVMEHFNELDLRGVWVMSSKNHIIIT